MTDLDTQMWFAYAELLARHHNVPVESRVHFVTGLMLGAGLATVLDDEEYLEHALHALASGRGPGTAAMDAFREIYKELPATVDDLLQRMQNEQN